MQADSWVFAPSRYTHNPDTGARVAQYERRAPIEPLPDRRFFNPGLPPVVDLDDDD